jgi:sporulation protein YlmC with PRC-barrel domain
MAKTMRMMAAVVFALGLWVTTALADEPTAMGMGKPFALSSLEGTHVFTPKGEYLGRVSDMVIDSQGQVTFMVVSHGGFLRLGGKQTAVPFGSFSYDREKRHFVLNSTLEQLSRAPVFTKRDLYSEKWAEDVYRHFGKAPYWTEGELVEKGMKPMEDRVIEYGEPFWPYGYTP